MKFLLWQFAAYALAAFLLGFAVASLWWRPLAARLARKLGSQTGQIAAMHREIVDLQASVQHDRNIVAAMAPLTEQLSVARSALTLVEAELEASALRHAMLSNKAKDLTKRADRHEALAGDAERAQGEALRTRVALDQAIADHALNRTANEQALAEALARAHNAESSLANLRRTHERLVVDSRRELTEITIRAEQSERIRLAPQVASAATVWQKAMAEASMESPSFTADDQILIVLPSDDEALDAGDAGSGIRAPRREMQSGTEGETSSERHHPEVSSIAVVPTTPVFIELRSSE